MNHNEDRKRGQDLLQEAAQRIDHCRERLLEKKDMLERAGFDIGNLLGKLSLAQEIIETQQDQQDQQTKD